MLLPVLLLTLNAHAGRLDLGTVEVPQVDTARAVPVAALYAPTGADCRARPLVVRHAFGVAKLVGDEGIAVSGAQPSPDGSVLPDLLLALQARRQDLQLAQASGCPAWQGGPLLVVDASTPASEVDRLLHTVGRAGFERWSLLVQAPAVAPATALLGVAPALAAPGVRSRQRLRRDDTLQVIDGWLPSLQDALFQAPSPTLTTLADHPLVNTLWHVREARPATTVELLMALRHAAHPLLGEKHDNVDHHLIQAALVRSLAPPAVVFEMLDGRSELQVATPDDVAEAVSWSTSGWPAFSLYAPVFQATLGAGARVVAAHPDDGTVKAVMGGAAPPDDLPFGDLSLSAQAAATFSDLITAAHCGHATAQVSEMMLRAQRLKDRYLAEGLVRSGEGSVLIAGVGHTRSDLGVPTLIPGTVSLQLVEVEPDQVDAAAYQVPGDFAWFTARVDLVDPCEAYREQLEGMHGAP